MHAVVVVPERPPGLLVRVDVVLVLPRVADVARIAVVLRQRRRPVQVHRRPRRVLQHRVGRGKAVDEADDRGATAGRFHGGAGDLAVVAPHGRLEPRKDIGDERLHRDPVVVRHAVRSGIDPAADRSKHRRLREGDGERQRQCAAGHVVGGRGQRVPGSFQRQRDRAARQDAHLEHVSPGKCHGLSFTRKAGRTACSRDQRGVTSPGLVPPRPAQAASTRVSDPCHGSSASRSTRDKTLGQETLKGGPG